MEERVRIATAESVELDFELAGPGSRFLALLVDTLISAAMILLAIIAILVTVSAAWGKIPDAVASIGASLSIISSFLIRWGYFLFFETRLSGQTPGKRLLGLRVIRDDGLPIGLRRSLIRNLLRVVDMLPPPLYLVGGISVLATRRGQRLGDIAAGTIVIRERFRKARKEGAGSGRAAGWVAKLEQGLSQYAVVVPSGTIDIRRIALIEEYFKRLPALGPEGRFDLSWRIARPLLGLFDAKAEEWEGAPDRLPRCESLLRDILNRAGGAAGDHEQKESGGGNAEKKARTWATFRQRTEKLLGSRKRELRRLSASDMKSLLVDYRRITTDLARAQSMGADRDTLATLGRMATGGHSVIYGFLPGSRRRRLRDWPSAFAREVRRGLWAVLLSAALFFLPAVISAVAVRWDPHLAYDLVGPEFYDFEPADPESLHRIPQLMRPVAASAIMTSNLQVALLAFAFGLTAGAGTAYLLVSNGINLGAVAAWFGVNGNARALWGWIMPHGATEIMAIIIAGAAGFLIAGGLLAPGRLKRSAALKLAAGRALVLELGCMAMLVVAGLIEGFVSPSLIPYALRLAIMAVSVAGWIAYFAAAGTRAPPLQL